MAVHIQSERHRVNGIYLFIHKSSRAKICCWSLSQMFLFAVLFSLSCVANSQALSPIKNNSNDDYTLSVDVNMVMLSATVVDRHNALVSGLNQGDFQVYEDHILQQIKHFSHEDLPVTVGLVIDNSGSMGTKRADVIAAALSFARSSNPQDETFVVNFNEHVTYGLPAGTQFADNVNQLQTALDSIKTSGETALYDGVFAALNHLKLGKWDKKVLVVISDGGDNASHHTLAQVIDLARQSGAIIYAIGIFDAQDADQNPGVLKRFAKETGGEAFFPASLAEISPICEGIAHDIRNQYTLSYSPTDSNQNGVYRVLDVKVNVPGREHLSVRTRAGYSLPSALEVPASGTVGRP